MMTDPVKLRARVRKTEDKILHIVGGSYNDDIMPFGWSDEAVKKEEIENLLRSRCVLLNRMWNPTREAMAHFRRVNDHLYNLKKRLDNRYRVLMTAKETLRDNDFDDDINIEGRMKFCYNDVDSILRLSDDDYYGSHFNAMAQVLDYLYDSGYGWEIVSADCGPDILDDGLSWDEPPFWGRPEFSDIVIQFPVHDLCNHRNFSIPDLVRLNDFICEVELKYQSITDQLGKRWSPDEK